MSRWKPAVNEERYKLDYSLYLYLQAQLGSRDWFLDYGADFFDVGNDHEWGLAKSGLAGDWNPCLTLWYVPVMSP